MMTGLRPDYDERIIYPFGLIDRMALSLLDGYTFTRCENRSSSTWLWSLVSATSAVAYVFAVSFSYRGRRVSGSTPA